MEYTRVTWQWAYDELWLKFRSEEFTFEKLLSVIFGKSAFSAREIKYGSKIINEMEDNGYVISRKADYDQRVRLYRLLRPELVSNAWAIFKKAAFAKGRKTFKVLSSDVLIREAHNRASWDYLFIKDAAIAFWTDNYRTSAVRHISVLEEQADGWVSLFKLLGLSVNLNGVPVSEAKGASEEAIGLHSDLQSRQHKKGKEHYQAAEHVILEALRDGDNLGALAVLIAQRKQLNWKTLIENAATNGLINTLGFSLEYMNQEAGKQVFSAATIERIRRKRQKEVETIKGVSGDEIAMGYKPLEEKWNAKCLDADAYRKAVNDLVK